MTKFEISYYRRAEKELDSLQAEEALQAMDDIDRFLTERPFPEGKRKKKIHGVKYPFYRLRVDTAKDSYRIFYLIEEKRIVILRVVKKKDAEKAIKSLRKKF